METRNHWLGVTPKEDKAAVVQSLKKLIRECVYDRCE